MRFVDDKLTIIVLTNQQKMFPALAEGVADIIAPASALLLHCKGPPGDGYRSPACGARCVRRNSVSHCPVANADISGRESDPTVIACSLPGASALSSHPYGVRPSRGRERSRCRSYRVLALAVGQTLLGYSVGVPTGDDSAHARYASVVRIDGEADNPRTCVAGSGCYIYPFVLAHGLPVASVPRSNSEASCAAL